MNQLGLIKRKVEGLTPARRCRVCGCTESMACVTPAGPCHWVEENLCSACQPNQPSKALKVVALILLLLIVGACARGADAPRLRYALLGSATNCVIALNYDPFPGRLYCVEESSDLRHWSDYDCRVSYEQTVWLLVMPTNRVRFFRLREEMP